MKFATKTAEPLLCEDPLHATIPELRGSELAAVYYGQRRCGDFYDFLRVSPERVLLALFDVAGDRERMRPIAVPLQSQFRTFGSQLFQTAGSNESEAMVALWIELNQSIMNAAGGAHACPAFLACYHEDLNTLTYVNSGHTPGLIRDNDSIHELPATALPLGLFSHAVPDSSVIALESGNALLLVSKGVVEAKHKGEEFGLDSAKQYFHEVRFTSAHETCVGLLSRLRQFMGTAPNHNDVTAMSLARAS